MNVQIQFRAVGGRFPWLCSMVRKQLVSAQILLLVVWLHEICKYITRPQIIYNDKLRKFSRSYQLPNQFGKSITTGHWTISSYPPTACLRWRCQSAAEDRGRVRDTGAGVVHEWWVTTRGYGYARVSHLCWWMNAFTSGTIIRPIKRHVSASNYTEEEHCFIPLEPPEYIGRK